MIRLPLLLLSLLISTLAAFAGGETKTFSLDASRVIAAREQLASADSPLSPSLAKLRRDADKLLKLRPASVLDKTKNRRQRKPA